MDITYQLDIYNAAGTSAALTLTSISGGTNPYLSSVPTGDGQEFDPLTGSCRRGQYTGKIADFITSGTTRVLTSNLEDANFRSQLMRRKTILKMILNGSTTVVLCAGYLTSLRLVNTIEYEYIVTDRTRIQGDQKIFGPRSAVVVLTASALAGATSLTCSALPIDIAKNQKLNFGAGKTGVVSAAASAGATSIAVTGLGIGGSTSAALASGDQATYTEPLAAYVARWPSRGCAFGGPIIGGFLSRADSGGWTMRYETYDSTRPFLRFVSGQGPSGSAVTTDPKSGLLAPTTNPAVGRFKRRERDIGSVAPVTTMDQARLSHFADDLVIEVIGVGYYLPTIYEAAARPDVEYFLVDTGRDRQGVFITSSTGLTPGNLYRVRAFTAMPSELSPIYYDAHPIDWLTNILTELGYSYDSASATTVKSAIGADLRYADRITQQQNGAAWAADTLLGPFGIGLRMQDDGDLEFFSARIFTNSAPATTITDADVLAPEEGGAGPVYEISESSAIAQVTFEHNQLETASDYQTRTGIIEPADIPPDGIFVTPIRIERLNGDPGVVGNRTHSWSVNGMVHRNLSYKPADDFLDLSIREIFDRFGRGVIECELPLLRGGSGDALRIGDECIVRLSQVPNRNKRYGDDTSVGGRAMQIVRYTPRATGALVKLLDSGPNAAAYGTTPTVTIAAGAGNFAARRTAELTVTNAATLNADGAGGYVLMAVTTGSTPASTDYSKVRWFDPGEIPIAAFPLPTVFAGSKVYAKFVATKPGSRPSAASTAASVTLTAISVVTGLAATPDGSDGATAVIDWVVGEDDHVVDVFLRLTSGTTVDDDVLIATLPPGSTSYTIPNLLAGTDYTVSVQHRHPVENDTSALVTDTMTMAGSAAALDAPTGERGFVGRQDIALGVPDDPGVAGIGVKVAAFPMDVIAEYDVGTGGGYTGSYTLIGRVPAKQGTWTAVWTLFPNDGFPRKIRARTVRPGQQESDGVSANTPDVIVTPFVPQPLQRTTKTIRLGAHLFQPSTYVSTTTVTKFTRSGGFLNVPVAATGLFYASLYLPVGSRLTAWRQRQGPDSALVVTSVLQVNDDSGISTTIDTLTATSAGSAITTSNTLNEVLDGSAYSVSLTLDASVVAPGPTQGFFMWVEFDYEATYLDQSI